MANVAKLWQRFVRALFCCCTEKDPVQHSAEKVFEDIPLEVVPLKRPVSRCIDIPKPRVDREDGWIDVDAASDRSSTLNADYERCEEVLPWKNKSRQRAYVLYVPKGFKSIVTK